ncbi:MAG: DNA polymerase IV [Methanomicrobiales archaeon]|nr:DNA polymerase IV [Methanomicrobiales archaeon]
MAAPLPVSQSPLQETRPQVILHVDMDSFYASVEMHRRPELRGRPVVVGADPKAGRGRGVVCTCSYEARVYGIRSAMPVSQAYTLCPHATFLPPDYEHYGLVSQEIMTFLKSFGFRMLQVSIDEAYLDISPCGSFGCARECAEEIRNQMVRRFGLTCSVGVAPGKTLAKIASDFHKPDGLTIVEPEHAREFLSPLPVRKIPGVGKKSETLLFEMGIRTIGDLAAADIQVLLARFGKGAVPLQEISRGMDTGGLEEYDGIKSLSRETTFEQDTDDPALLVATLETLTRDVWENLGAENLRCRTITIKIRYQGFITQTRSHSLPHYTREHGPLESGIRALFRETWDGRKVRLIGIRLSSLEKQNRGQMTLDT